MPDEAEELAALASLLRAVDFAHDLEQARRAWRERTVCLLVELLDILDGMDRGARAGDANAALFATQLVLALERAGAELLDPIGAEFQPSEQKVVEAWPGDPPGVVLAVLARGCRWEGILLRPASVVVSKS